MTANWRPDLYFAVSFNADPLDMGAVPVWSDLTIRMRLMEQVTRGRQYELNETQAGTPTMLLEDIDEYLNPANTSSPYYPNVVPNRFAVLMGIWPQSTAGNMLNTSAPLAIAFRPPVGEVQSPAVFLVGEYYDGSLESYTVGSNVPWISIVGFELDLPIISTTTPHTGSQDITYTVVASNNVQGVLWPVPCIPGRQYTSSAYVRQSSANTQTIQVADQNQVIDAFNRVTASGWGTADYGGAWTRAGGAAADFFTAVGTTVPWVGTASHSVTAVNSNYYTTAGTSILDSDQRVTVIAPAMATGNEIDAGLVSRFANTSNNYRVELFFNTSGRVGLRTLRRVAGSSTTINTVSSLPFPYVTGTVIQLRFRTAGDSIQAKAWLDGTLEPPDWDLDDVDDNITAAGQVGVRSFLNSANTNTLPVVFQYQSYSCVGSVVGTNTTTTGSYVRLSVTWTATQTVHTVQLATQAASALDGTILVDDIQHEEAASSSAFTTSGPVLYSIFRGYVARWPSGWQSNSQGYEGLAPITLTDAFSPLNTFGMLAAYPAAVMGTDPFLYYPLWDQTDSVSFAEITGNGQPLVFLSAKSGPGTLPAAGTTMGVLGDPGGVGVTFDPGATPAVTTSARTALAAGSLAGQTPILLPSVIGTSWAVSVAAWVRLVDNGTFQAIAVLTDPLFIYTVFLEGATTIIENNVGGTTFTNTTTPAGTIEDGLLHHVVGQVVQDSTNTSLYWWADGVLVGSKTVATSTLGGLQASQSKSILVGATSSMGYVFDGSNGDIAHVSVWNRQITGTEIANLYQAGLGWVNETSDQRIRRYLTGETVNAAFTVAGAYSGPVDIDPDALSVMGPDVLTTGTDALTACQAVATTENGVFWGAPIALSFAGREVRYLETSSVLTFGENTAGGEFPYLGTILFDYDLTLVYNPVQVTNADGIVATASDATFGRRFSAQTYPRDINVADDNEAIDAATYLLAQHKQATQRVDQIVLNPAAWPALWPVVLSIEVGTRVTVKRRAKAANSGVGITMSADYFVEKISHDSIDMEASTWLTTLQLSPVDTSQVWILENTTYGVLDSTTVLGY